MKIRKELTLNLSEQYNEKLRDFGRKRKRKTVKQDLGEVVPYQDGASQQNALFKIVNQEIDITFLSPQSFSVLDGQLVVSQKKAYLDALVLNLMRESQSPLASELRMRHIYSQKHKSYFTQFFGKHTPISSCCKMPVQVELSQEKGGKLTCLDAICHHNPLRRFLIKPPDHEYLFQ